MRPITFANCQLSAINSFSDCAHVETTLRTTLGIAGFPGLKSALERRPSIADLIIKPSPDVPVGRRCFGITNLLSDVGEFKQAQMDAHVNGVAFGHSPAFSARNNYKLRPGRVESLTHSVSARGVVPGFFNSALRSDTCGSRNPVIEISRSSSIRSSDSCGSSRAQSAVPACAF